MHGFQVYGTEVDDRGIDFVARHENGPFLEVQVKSARTTNYVFMGKHHFKPSKELFLAFGLLKDDNEPVLYLIPSLVWNDPNGTFVSRDYDGLKSKPEWGLNLSTKNISALEEFAFHQAIRGLFV